MHALFPPFVCLLTVRAQDWIQTRETIDEDHVALLGDPTSISASASKAHKVQYLPVPDDPILANSVCPICQEKFETRWLDEAQEFVWPDALRVGDRIYHASCHKEATGGGGGALYSRGTPEPSLGRKRKAEVSSPQADRDAAHLRLRNRCLLTDG
jgi:pre-mRNA cleavage complex 2 protein Pcf11